MHLNRTQPSSFFSAFSTIKFTVVLKIPGHKIFSVISTVNQIIKCKVINYKIPLIKKLRII